jgi:cell division protein FtsB
MSRIRERGEGAPWRRHHGLAVLCGMGALALLLLVLSVFGDQGIFKIRSLVRDRQMLEGKVAEVERENEALRRRLRDVGEGRSSYELAAREKLGLVKPGEIVYDFRSDPLRGGQGPGAAAGR